MSSHHCNAISDDELDSSSEEDASVEVISPPPRRPVTRSVSAKRAAGEMEDNDDLPISSPPRPRKVQRVVGVPGAFADRDYRRLTTNPP